MQTAYATCWYTYVARTYLNTPIYIHTHVRVYIHANANPALIPCPKPRALNLKPKPTPKHANVCIHRTHTETGEKDRESKHFKSAKVERDSKYISALGPIHTPV